MRSVTPALTREAVEKMEAGPEMDALVARTVLGCNPKARMYYPATGTHEYECDCPRQAAILLPYADRPHGAFDAPLKRYSTDIAAAWEVVEKIVSTPRGQDADGFMLTVDIQAPPKPYPGEDFCVSFYHYDGSKPGAAAPTAPLAICRAALLATL